MNKMKNIIVNLNLMQMIIHFKIINGIQILNY